MLFPLDRANPLKSMVPLPGPGILFLERAPDRLSVQVVFLLPALPGFGVQAAQKPIGRTPGNPAQLPAGRGGRAMLTIPALERLAFFHIFSVPPIF